MFREPDDLGRIHRLSLIANYQSLITNHFPMKPITVTQRFEVPAPQAWSLISDLEGAPQRIEGIKKIEILTNGPAGRGTRFRETRVVFGREHSEEMEITEWSPPRSYVLECDSCGCHYRSTMSVRPDGNGSVVEMNFEAQGMSFFAKLFGWLMGPMMAKQCRKAFEKDLGDLKRAAEAGNGSAAAAAPAV